MKSLLLFIAVSVLVGCAKSPSIQDLTSDELTKYSKIAVYMKGQSDSPAKYSAISPVEGVDCKRNLYSSEDAKGSKAFDSMKVVAAKAGASAIINAECFDEGTSWSKNCWQTQVCRGIAIE